MAFAPVPVPPDEPGPDLAPGANPLGGCEQKSNTGNANHAQCGGQGLCFCLLYLPELFPSFVVGLRSITLIPVYVLVLLPPSSGSIDAVSEVILLEENCDE